MGAGLASDPTAPASPDGGAGTGVRATTTSTSQSVAKTASDTATTTGHIHTRTQAKAEAAGGGGAEVEVEVEVEVQGQKRAAWWYKDPAGLEQGPFGDDEMTDWHMRGYFKDDLMVRAGAWPSFVLLGKLIAVRKRNQWPLFGPLDGPLGASVGAAGTPDQGDSRGDEPQQAASGTSGAVNPGGYGPEQARVGTGGTADARPQHVPDGGTAGTPRAAPARATRVDPGQAQGSAAAVTQPSSTRRAPKLKARQRCKGPDHDWSAEPLDNSKGPLSGRQGRRPRQGRTAPHKARRETPRPTADSAAPRRALGKQPEPPRTDANQRRNQKQKQGQPRAHPASAAEQRRLQGAHLATETPVGRVAEPAALPLAHSGVAPPTRAQNTGAGPPHQPPPQPSQGYHAAPLLPPPVYSLLGILPMPTTSPPVHAPLNFGIAQPPALLRHGVFCQAEGHPGL